MKDEKMRTLGEKVISETADTIRINDTIFGRLDTEELTKAAFNLTRQFP